LWSVIKSGKDVVAIDTNMEKYERVVKENIGLKDFHFLQGDATKEEILMQAGVNNAYGIITCVRDDAVNLFIALTAKKINPNIKISCYVLDEINMSKFNMIGADEVISGDYVVAKRLTTSLLNKNISSFLDETTSLGENSTFYIGDVKVSHKSKIAYKTLREAEIYKAVGLLIFALKKKNKDRYTFNPNSDIVLEPGDVLITFGSQSDLNKLENYVNG